MNCQRKNFLSIVLVAMLLLMNIVAVKGQEQVGDWEKAVSLYKQGQFKEASVEFQQVLKEYPDHADSWKYLGLAYYQLKDYRGAVPTLQKANELKRKEGKNDPDLIRALGQSFLSEQKYAEALPYLETLTRMQMNVSSNFYLLGVAYANLNRESDAAQAFTKAVTLNPKDSDSWYYVAIQFYRKGQIDQTISALRKGLAATPNNPEMLQLLTESLLRKGSEEVDERKSNTYFDEAIKSGNALISVQPNTDTYDLLGRAYLASKKYTNAELTLSRALESNKTPSAALYFNLGYAHAQNKVWERSAAMLEQANKLNPKDFNTLYYLGYVYENLRKYSDALKTYSRAFEIDGGKNPEIKAAIDRVSQLTRQ